MKDHITRTDLLDLMEQFLLENPQGDSVELACYMYNAGFEAGEGGDNFQ